MRKQLALVAVLTGLSQLAAFFKLWFTARMFGVSAELDGYNLALVVPTMIAGTMAGLIQTGFFPVRAGLHVKGDTNATETFERTVLWACALLGVMLTAMLIATIPWLTPIMVPIEQAAVRAAFMTVLPFAAVLIVLNMIGDCAGYILAMRQRFAYAAGAPISNGILGGIILALWPDGGILSLITSTVVGLLAQLTICILGLKRSNFRLIGRISTGTSSLRLLANMIKLSAWIIPGLIFSNLIVALPPLWAASFGEGAVSAFSYAYRLHTSTVQLLVMASTTLILARFSDLVASKDTTGVRLLIRHSTQLSFAIGLLALTLVWAIGAQLLEWLFGGRFDAESASRVATLWTWLTVGLSFTLLGNVFAKLWQAQSRPKLMSAVAASSLATLCVSYFLLRRTMNEEAIAFALAATSASVVFIGYRFLNERHLATSALDR